jgi:hypothetical protein
MLWFVSTRVVYGVTGPVVAGRAELAVAAILCGGIADLPGARLIPTCRGACTRAIRIAVREQPVAAIRALGGPCLPAADVRLRSGGYPELRA